MRVINQSLENNRVVTQPREDHILRLIQFSLPRMKTVNQIVACNA